MVIVENVPLHFDPENTYAKTNVAGVNRINENDILEVHYLKLASQQKEGQRTGQVLFKLRS